MLQRWRTARARCSVASRRCWSSASNGKPGKKKADEPVELPSRTPGVTRIQRGRAAEKDLEVDSTIARIIGSDWGDRRGQAVSLPMRIYWVVFAVVLLNGAYTYFSGKDESFLVEKLRKKVDEKVGSAEEPSEFEVIAGEDEPVPSTNEPTDAKPASAAPPPTAGTATPAPVSIFNAPPTASTSPFFSPAVASRPSPVAPRAQSKDELNAQLNHLRARQQSLRETARTADGRRREQMKHDIRMIDEQKAELKRALKHL